MRRVLSVICLAAAGVAFAGAQTYEFTSCTSGVTLKTTVGSIVTKSGPNNLGSGARSTVYIFNGSFSLTRGQSTLSSSGVGGISILLSPLGPAGSPQYTTFIIQVPNANGDGPGTGRPREDLAWGAALQGDGDLLPNGLPQTLPPISRWVVSGIPNRAYDRIYGDGVNYGLIEGFGSCPPGSPEDPYKLLGDPVTCCGDPINIATGNLFEQVADYQVPGPDKLAFIRYYNSLGAANTFATTLGANWRSNYDRSLRIVSPTSVTAERPDGPQLNFALTGSVWKTDTDVDLGLASSGTTWTLTGADDSVETYRTASATQALLQTVRARNGYTLNLQYNSINQLTTVTDSFNRVLSFTYNNGLLQTVTTPDQLALTYGYSGAGAAARLTSVAYSTSPVTRQTYVYENAALPSALTGVIDENGNRYSTWTYDSTGRALSSQHAGGADLTRITYNTDGSRTVTYPLGVQAVYKFTTLQGVLKVTEIDRLATSTTAAAITKFTYDSNGYIASQTDWNGVVTNYVNDIRGQQLSIVEAADTPQARTTTMTYHPTFHMPVRIVEPGMTTTITYDATGNVLTRTSTDTTTTTVPYSTNGQTRTWNYTWSNSLLASIKKPRTDLSAATQYTYDASGALVATTNALGQVTKITQHLPGGLPQTVADPNGVTAQLTYDARLRLLTRTINTAPGPRVTSYTYDQAGNLLRVTKSDGSALTVAYDAAHRRTGVSDVLGQRTISTLDVQGNPTKSSVLDSSGVQQGTRSRRFDALGRLTQETSGAGQTTAYGHDSNGNVLTITDPLGRVTQQAFDPLNRLIKRTDPATGIATTVYDSHGRPTSITDQNGGITSFVYNGFGDLIQRVSPDSGTTVYYYDPNGNLTRSTDAAGAIVDYAYDALDRITSIQYPADPAGTVTYTYDQTTNGFGIGRLGAVTDLAGSLKRSYDARGDIVSESRITGGASLVTAYTYDAARRVGSITYPSGGIASYTRDAMGRITAVTYQALDGSDPIPVVSGVGYQPFGPLNALTFGNGVAEARAFDLDYRMTGLSDTGSSAVQSLVYGYDVAGNLSSITDGVNPGASQTFGYDALDRLTSATGGYGSLGYTYDGAGNRLTQSGGQAATYQYAPRSNQITALTANGARQSIGHTKTGHLNSFNPASGGLSDFTYDQAGRLATVMSGNDVIAKYTYDAFERRLVKLGATSGTTLYQYDREGLLLEENDGEGRPLADYIYLGSMPVATVSPADGQVYFLHDDRLGAPQLATDSNQNVVWIGSYTPFGEMTTSPHLIVQDLRLPGQEYDSDTGLYHNGFRNYIPGWGRYLESDPIGLAGGMNTYAYAGGNPLNSIDPYGLRVNLIFEPPGSAHEKAYLDTPSIPGLYTVGGDGNPGGVSDQYGHKIEVKQLADMIRSDPDYHPGEMVRLDVCRLGLGTYAQELSNELNAIVLAADNFVWSGDPHGPIVAPIDYARSTLVSATEHQKHLVPDLTTHGSWIEFRPK